MWYRFSRKFLSTLWGTFWSLFSAAAISAALLLLLLRVSVSSVELFQPHITAWLSERLGAPVELGAVAVELDGRFLNLQLEGLRIGAAEGEGRVVSLESGAVQIDLLASLRYRMPVTTTLEINGPELHLEHSADGRLSIAGSRLEGGGDSARWGGWLLKQPQFAITNATLEIRESRVGQLRWSLTEVDLRLLNSGYRHQASGSALLDGAKRSPLELQLEWFGDLYNPQGWDGQMHLHGDAIHLQDLIGWGDSPWGSLAQGEAELSLWAEWLSGQLERGRASLQRAPQYKGAPGLAGGEFHWSKLGEEAWRLQMEQLVWGGEQAQERRSHPSSALLERKLGSQGEALLFGAVDHIRLVPSPELSGLYATIAHGNGGVLVAGSLNQVKFRSFPDKQGLFSGIEAKMELESLSVAGTGGLAGQGVSGVSGVLHLNQRRGYFVPQAGALSVVARELYPEPVTLELQRGVLHWERHPQALLLTLERFRGLFRGAQLNGGIQLLKPDSGSAMLNMRLGLTAQRLTELVDGLPSSQLDPALLEWLQHALLSGEVRSGLVEIQGAVDRFPYQQGEGVFKATLGLNDLYLQFDPAWPAITHSQAQLIFDRQKLRIELQQGKLDGHPIHSVSATTALTGDEPLQIHGRLVSDSGALLRTLEQTPLQKTAMQLNRVVALEGYALLDLDLVVPWTDDPEQVSGRVELHDNRLTLSEVGLDLEQLSGNLEFTGEGVSIEGMRGELLGGPLEMTAFTATENGRSQVVVGLSGVLFGEQMERWLELDDAQRTLFESRAKTAWDGRLRIEEEQIELHLHSDLKGIALYAPAPLDKRVDERWPTTLTLKVRGGEVEQLRLSTPQRIRIDLGKEPAKGVSPGLWSGLVQLGESVSAATQPQPRSGVELVASFQQASLDAWYTLWKEKLDRGEQSRFAGFNLQKMVISADQAALFGQSLDNLALVMQLDESGYWVIGVSSEQVEGSVRVPSDPAEAMVVDLSYLQLGARGEAGSGESVRSLVDPSQFPALQVQSQRTVINGIDFGALQLQTEPTPSGLLVDHATLRSDVMLAQAQGTWLQWGEQARSRFLIDVEGERLGAILGLFGYAGQIDRGKSKIQIHAEWPDTPLDFDLRKMDGKLKVVVEKGQLQDLDQGVGRVFGLLGIHTLVRRLTLDFSDITDKGFAFDTIEGAFALRKGDAHTRNLVIDGPSATIRVEGRTGIVAQDYDQLVRVSPKISETLPATGALVGGPAGAAVGSVLLLYQKLFQKEGLASTRYQLRGSWDAPQLEEIRPKAPVSEPAFFE
jgi:uncharacterized protein (TIGR02099 family)